MEYRVLSRAEISKLGQLDRTEAIDGVYYMRDGVLVLEKEHWDVPEWSLSEKRRRIANLQQLYDRGAAFFGAFDGAVLAGMSVLDYNPLPTGVDRLNLAGLWVSCGYRGRGIGKNLFLLAKEEARGRRAKTLYVSATPSEDTVRFYQSAGFQLSKQIDPALFEKEPEDIHMELTF